VCWLSSTQLLASTGEGSIRLFDVNLQGHTLSQTRKKDVLAATTKSLKTDVMFAFQILSALV